jgi:predicted dehydrogenase
MAARLALAVLAAGLIGSRHIEHILEAPEAELVAIVDPSPAARDVAETAGVAWLPDFAALMASSRPDGVVVATPNQLHVRNGLDCVAARIPALIEKPIADDIAEGRRLVEAAEAAGVPLLVGHHRRHNPLIAKAKELIEGGRIGTILAVHGSTWFFKPDDYFEAAWRRAKGAGPVLLNLIHDVDLLRYLIGDVASVQALESNAVRGNEVEETAAITLRFKSGALGTITVSDAVVAPWSWELTSGENPACPKTDQACYHIGATHGALTIPQLEIWHNPGARSWWEPIERERLPFTPADPLALQIRHFCEVVRGEAQPLVSGREGLKSLEVVLAVKEAAATGRMVVLCSQ